MLIENVWISGNETIELRSISFGPRFSFKERRVYTEQETLFVIACLLVLFEF